MLIGRSNWFVGAGWGFPNREIPRHVIYRVLGVELTFQDGASWSLVLTLLGARVNVGRLGAAK